MMFLAYFILKLETKKSQKNMLKLDFSLFEQTPHLGLVRTWDGVCLLDVPDICMVSLNSRARSILFVLCSNKPHMDVF